MKFRGDKQSFENIIKLLKDNNVMNLDDLNNLSYLDYLNYLDDLNYQNNFIVAKGNNDINLLEISAALIFSIVILIKLYLYL